MSKTVLISPFASALRNGKDSPKNFPHWKELVGMLLDEYNVIQIGASKDSPIIPPFKSDLHSFATGQLPDFQFVQNAPLPQIRQMIKDTDTWISVDSFLQHMNEYYDRKKGIVIWSQSDPRIFGYKHNVNLLKDRKYLRDKQFWLWEQCEYNADAFVTAEEVFKAVKTLIDPVE
jgi:ADP-heptose:LPS heptosyltransferase